MGPVDHGGVSADRRPSYEELAGENTELRATVSDLRSVVEVLRAEVAELKRQLGQHSRKLVEAAVVGLAVYRTGAEVAAAQERPQAGRATGVSVGLSPPPG